MCRICDRIAIYSGIFSKTLFSNNATYCLITMPAKYQIFKDTEGKCRFRLKAANNEIIAVSEAYEQNASCLNGIKSMQKNCSADVEDTTIEGRKSLIRNTRFYMMKAVDTDST